MKPEDQSQPMRIGHGYDVHRFSDEESATTSVTLGGVVIPHNRSLLAHSDGDVALHAVCDALLGAIAAGDIGQHFPDTDAAYADADSSELLSTVYQLVTAAGYQLGNLDVTLVAQAPRLAEHIPAMRERLASLLKSSIGQVNVKATTTEKLGFVGREEGIAVHAVVIIYKTS